MGPMGLMGLMGQINRLPDRAGSCENLRILGSACVSLGVLCVFVVKFCLSAQVLANGDSHVGGAD
jgi:uncharacterized protein YjeT (DUF2065 family)